MTNQDADTDSDRLDESWRLPNNAELAVLERLLAAEGPGIDRLRQQLPGLRVRPLDQDGCLELKVENKLRTDVAFAVPVEATFSVSGGPFDPFSANAHVLLHIKDGLLHELEFYTDDPGDHNRLPAPDEMHIFTPYQSGNE